VNFTILTVDNGVLYAVGSDSNVYKWTPAGWAVAFKTVALGLLPAPLKLAPPALVAASTAPTGTKAVAPVVAQ